MVMIPVGGIYNLKCSYLLFTSVIDYKHPILNKVASQFLFYNCSLRAC